MSKLSGETVYIIVEYRADMEGEVLAVLSDEEKAKSIVIEMNNADERIYYYEYESIQIDDMTPLSMARHMPNKFERWLSWLMSAPVTRPKL